MRERLSVFEWAKRYCGDPASYDARSSMILEFLQEEGLRPDHTLLDVGCGCLSPGYALIRYLEPSHYVGIDPNGWLVEAAIAEMPDLEDRDPEFVWTDDFNAKRSSVDRFDYVVAHSVLSHVAHWQLELALHKVRASVDEGAVWLASLRLDQYDLHARQWVYPDVSYFRLETVKMLGYQAGWAVEHVPEYRDRLTKTCPNDVHDWVRLRAIPTTGEANELRLAEEARIARDREILEIAEGIYRDRESQRGAA